MRLEPQNRRFSNLKSIAAFLLLALAFVATLLYLSAPGPSIPFGTNSELAAAMWDSYKNPPTDYWSYRPGWTGITPTPSMLKIESFGADAIPVLIANINNKNEMMRLQSIELLGTLRAEAAVPALIDALRYDDGLDDAFIIANLANITDHPRGYEFYRGWFDEKKQLAATAAYREWWDHQQASGSLKKTENVPPERR